MFQSKWITDVNAGGHHHDIGMLLLILIVNRLVFIQYYL
jgi:hypothetical protein